MKNLTARQEEALHQEARNFMDEMRTKYDIKLIASLDEFLWALSVYDSLSLEDYKKGVAISNKFYS